MKKDIVATIGTYEKDGVKKYITRNVGMLLETEKGFSIKLDASFNPAGCVRKEDGSVWLACFDQKEKDAPKQPTRTYNAPDDDIPF